MLTESMRKHICLRLGSLAKYSCTNNYYWDNKHNKFVLCHSFVLWTFAIIFYVFHIFALLFAIFLWTLAQDLISPEFQEISENVGQNDVKLLTLVFGTLLWFLLSGILEIFSVSYQYREEMCTVMTQALKLDLQLLKKFVTEKDLPMPEYPQKKRLEWLVKFDCWFPSVFPILIGLILFVPGDPIHSYLEWLFEIKFRWNWETLPMVVIVVVSVNVGVAVVVNIIIVGLTPIIVWLFWLEAACPGVGTNRKNWNDELTYLETNKIAKISKDDLIWMHRSFQILSGLVNTFAATPRVAYHMFVAQMVFVGASFTLLSFQNTILAGSPIGYVLFGLLLSAAILSVVIISVESFALDKVQNLSENLKNVLIKSTPRRSALRKTARSMRDITIHSAGPYFRVNKSSFMEWCNQGVDRLMNFLCTF